MEIEFLVPEVGKSRNKPFPLKNLNTNAQRIRYLDIIENHPMEMVFQGLKIVVPQPAAFVINKIIISQRRLNVAKKEKDLLSAAELGTYILRFHQQKTLLKNIFNDLTPRLQRKILEILKKDSNDIYDILSDKKKI